jgi:hypothetical protein
MAEQETSRRKGGGSGQAANTLAKNIAVTRTVTPERIEHLSALVRRGADELAGKVLRRDTRRSQG